MLWASCWGQLWDPADGRWERDYERQQRLKAEAAKQAALEAEAQAFRERLAALAAQQPEEAAGRARAVGGAVQQPHGASLIIPNNDSMSA